MLHNKTKVHVLFILNTQEMSMTIEVIKDLGEGSLWWSGIELSRLDVTDSFLL